jgi:hypothetical protein
MATEVPFNQLSATVTAQLGRDMRAVKIALFNGVIRDTRVDTGRLRGNWQTTTGQEAGGTLERLDPSGAQAQSEVIATVKADTVDYLTNNLPYSEVWEERDGMVARNVARIERIVEEVARAAN